MRSTCSWTRMRTRGPGTAWTGAAGGRIETQVDWPHLGDTRGTAFATVHARGFDGATDRADFALNVAGGSLVVRQIPVVPETVTNASAPLLRLGGTPLPAGARWGGVTGPPSRSAPGPATGATARA